MLRIKMNEEEVSAGRVAELKLAADPSENQSIGQQKWREAAAILALGALAAHAQRRDIHQNAPTS